MAAGTIRKRLLWSLLGAVLGLWLVALVVSYYDAHRELDRLFDAQLAQSAQLLSSQAGHELLELEELEREDLQQYARHFAVQLWDTRSRLLLRMGAAPATRFSETEYGFSDATIEGQRWRVFSDWDVEHQILVQMAERHDARERLAAQIALNALLPLLVAVPLMGALIGWIVTGGLAPIRRISEEVARRDQGNLDRLDIGAAPGEVHPLVERLNALFERIERSIANEKRFTADAAHELRNPVAAIRAQAEVSLAAQDPSAVRAGLSNIAASAARLSRLVDQLLALARLDAAKNRIFLTELDLTKVAKQTLAELAPSAMERGAAIDFDGPASAIVPGDAALLAAVIRNLVENAVVHGGPGVHIATRIAEVDGACELIVEDDGPGVPAQQREGLGRRFFRGEARDAEGSGLGLSLVERIVELHRATIKYGESAGHRGLKVCIRFPPAHAAADHERPHGGASPVHSAG
jgi:two-component system, OmpR family, sensor histidine kinase QseC